MTLLFTILFGLSPSKGIVGRTITHPPERTPAAIQVSDNDYAIGLFGDVHGDYDHRVFNSDRPANVLATTFWVDRMAADAFLGLGDMMGDRSVDVDGDRDADCTVDRAWNTVCEFPSPHLKSLYVNAIDTYATGPTWWLGGNHDGHPAIPTLQNLATPNKWWNETFHVLSQPGVIEVGTWSNGDHFEVQVTLLDGTTWSILAISDLSWKQDRAYGGRCDLRDNPTDFTKCSTRAWPVGVISEEQYQWLDAAITRAASAGRKVMIATHQPPAGTVVLTREAGDAHAEVCTGIRVHSETAANHFPLDADLLPARTDLNTPVPGDPGGRTPIEIAHDWASAMIRWPPGGLPDETWALDMLADHIGEVELWVSAHNHLPVPDLTYNERGVRYDDPVSGTTFLSVSAATRGWCTTTGACIPQGSKLVLTNTGWSWERWVIQSSSVTLPSACTTAATVPGVRPAPWGNLGAETGSF